VCVNASAIKKTIDMEVDDLIKNIHDFILGQYNGSFDGSNTFLAF